MSGGSGVGVVEFRNRHTRSVRPWLVIAGLCAVVVLVLASPLITVRLLGFALPWDRLADIGEAYGGASALLSAAALCGVGASLIFQRRQVRQELAEIDRQHHIELLKLAIENPELIEVLDQRTAESPYARHQLYANLVMMYWLSMWQLGEVDDQQLRGMAAMMFRSEVTRNWWAEYGDSWIGTVGRPDRARFISMISAEQRLAQRHAGALAAQPADDRAHVRERHHATWAVALISGASAMLLLAPLLRQLRKSG